MENFSTKTLIGCFVALLLLCIAAALFAGGFGGGSVVIVRIGGAEYAAINLNEVKEAYLLELPTGNVLLVESGAVSMHSADCADQLCVHQGKLGENGGALPIVCLPNRVVLEQQPASAYDGGEIDAVSGR